MSEEFEKLVSAEWEKYTSQFDLYSNEWIDKGLDEVFKAGFIAAKNKYAPPHLQGETESYSKTPWRERGSVSIVDGDGQRIIGAHLLSKTDFKTDAANIRRIIACVNRLERFTTEQIEEGIDIGDRHD